MLQRDRDGRGCRGSRSVLISLEDHMITGAVLALFPGAEQDMPRRHERGG